MTTPRSQSREEQFQGYPKRDDSRSHIFAPQSIDLKTANATTAIIYDASGMNRATVRVQTETWGTAETTLQGSIDAENWTDIATLNSATPQATEQDIEDYAFLRLKVTTRDAAAVAGLGTVYVYHIGTATDFFSDLELAIPTQVGRGQQRVWTTDDQTHQLLTQILNELRVANVHLAMMTDVKVDAGTTL